MEEFSMSDISELELQNLRHLILGFETTKSKMEDYASCTEDTNLKQFFQQGAQEAQKNKQTLMSFLQ